MLNLTPVVRNIIIINVIVYIIQMMWQPATSFLSLYDINSGYFRPYQFLTYMFAHSPTGFLHIFFNMLTLASIAPVLESYWGDKKFLLFYLASGIGAGVIYAVVHLLFNSSGGAMLGASGAIYGVLMGFGLLFPNMQISMLFIPMPAKYLVFVVGLLTYFMDRSGQVAHLAHFGGAFVAFLLVSYWRSQGER
ncbi:hypothetical protein BH10BAC4_BH10BAC4_20610 [soil metagenome]